MRWKSSEQSCRSWRSSKVCCALARRTIVATLVAPWNARERSVTSLQDTKATTSAPNSPINAVTAARSQNVRTLVTRSPTTPQFSGIFVSNTALALKSANTAKVNAAMRRDHTIRYTSARALRAASSNVYTAIKDVCLPSITTMSKQKLLKWKAIRTLGSYIYVPIYTNVLTFAVRKVSAGTGLSRPERFPSRQPPTSLLSRSMIGLNVQSPSPQESLSMMEDASAVKIIPATNDVQIVTTIARWNSTMLGHTVQIII